MMERVILFACLIKTVFCDCSIELSKLTKDANQPIFYIDNPIGQYLQFWPVTLESPGVSVMRVANGQTMSIYCKHKFRGYDAELLNVKCFGNVLKADDGVWDESSIVNFRNLNCKEQQIAQQLETGRPCATNGQIIQIYFEAACKPIVVYESCHEKKYHANHYVHHFMTPANSAYQAGVREAKFVADGVYGNLDVNDIYRKIEVKGEFADVWGKEVNVLLPNRGSQYIAKGHLMANKDGALANFQRATFFHVNVMPQFQCSNQCNWLSVEKAVRRFVGVYGRNIELFTGTYSVMKYRGVMLYLSSYLNKHLFPIPNIFYKMLINRNDGEGMVIVGINNVLTDELGINEFIYCGDKSDESNIFSGSSFDAAARERIAKGAIYVCTLYEFMDSLKMRDWSEYRDFLKYNLMKIGVPGVSLDNCEENSMC